MRTKVLMAAEFPLESVFSGPAVCRNVLRVGEGVQSPFPILLLCLSFCSLAGIVPGTAAPPSLVE